MARCAVSSLIDSRGVDIATEGTLAVVAHRHSGGRRLQHTALDPEDLNLIVAKQDGDVLSAHRLDRDEMPIGKSRQIAGGTPMCTRFVG